MTANEFIAVENGSVCWITGLSGAGKSTLAREVVARLQSDARPVVMLDGDDLREVFGASRVSEGHHTRESRVALAMQYARLCRVLAAQGAVVVIATISLFREVHAWNRENLPGYLEVYLKVPLAELRRRDPKGIYRRFDAGELTDVAGLDLPVDEPRAPDLVVDVQQSGHEPSRIVDDLVRRITHTA